MPRPTNIVTITLNPAIDRVIEVHNLRPGAHQPGRTTVRQPAGKGVNVSRALAMLEVPHVASGFLGRESSEEFEALFENSYIRDEFIRVPGRVRENITLADAAAHEETHIREHGQAIDPEQLDLLRDQLSRLAQPGAVIVFSGSLPPGVENGDFASLVDFCLSRESRVVVDTSGDALTAVADRALWMLAPNRKELASLAGRALPDLQSAVAAAKELTDHVRQVLLSCGSLGAFLVTGEQTHYGRADLLPGHVRNTVGCGDVLLGSYLAGVYNELPPAEALQRAVAAAAASAASPTTATFAIELMQQLAGKVQTRPRNFE